MSSQYFPPYVVSKNSSIKVVLDLSGYVKETHSDVVKKKDLSYFWDKNYFDSNDGSQNYLVFKVKKEYFDRTDFTSNVPLGSLNLWTSTGVSSQSFDAPDQKVNISTNEKTRPFNVALEKKNGLFVQSSGGGRYTGSVVNIYIVYKLSSKSITSSNALKNCLFGATQMLNAATKDPQKYNYSGYGIIFDRTGQFTHSDGNSAGNVIIFVADLSDSKHDNNKKQNILVLGSGFILKINNNVFRILKKHSMYSQQNVFSKL